jgi:hypothetical protein
MIIVISALLLTGVVSAIFLGYLVGGFIKKNSSF